MSFFVLIESLIDISAAIEDTRRVFLPHNIGTQMMKKLLLLSAAFGFLFSVVTSADAARRAKGPIIIITAKKEIVSHS